MPIRELVLLLVAAAWGATFLGAQTALGEFGPFTFLALRCFLAAAAVSLIFGRRLPGLGPAERSAGAVLGAIVATALGLQMIGLQWLPSSKSGF